MKCEGSGWTMYLGDCIEVMASLAPVDHVVTDPPYEEHCHAKSRESGKGGDARKRGVVRKAISFAAMDEVTRSAAGDAFARLAKRWTLIFCQSEALHLWAAACPKLRHVRSCVWVKPDSSPQFTGDRPAAGFEFIEILHQPGKTRWNGGGRRGVFTHGSKDVVNRPDDHDTPKPIPLMVELVELFTEPGEVVLDPFAGSGSTGVACFRTGRQFVGIEKDRGSFDLACERLRAEEAGSTLRASRAGQTSLFGVERP